MRRRVFSGLRQSIGAKLLLLCTVAMFVAGTSATLAEVKPPQKGGSKGTLSGDISFSPPGQNTVSLTNRADISTPAQGSDDRSVLAGCNTTVLVGAQGTSGNGRAPNSNWRFIRSHYLITAAEMAASGFPSGATPQDITWAYTVGGNPATGALKIYLENTADATNLKSTDWATAIATMTLVSDNAAQALPTTAGPFTVPFVAGTPLAYTGGGLYVAFDWEWIGPVVTQPAVVDCNTALVNGLKGAQSATGPAPVTVAASSFRPFTRFTPSTGFANDVSIDLNRSYGVVPTTLVSPHVITAVVTNKGTNAQSNVPVTLAITGADSFNDVQNVAALPACGGQAVTTFGAWTPSLPIGSDTSTVSIAADDNNANNSLAKAIDETNNRYSYKHPGSTSSGGVGFNAPGVGAFVAAFAITQPAMVSEVELEFFAASATTYRVAIYGDNAGAPSTTALYVDAADRTVGVAGPVVITLPAPVSVPAGRFYAGIQQNTPVNASLAFDSEAPIRPNSFFLATSLPPAGWVDFAPANSFKLNIGVKLIQCSVAADCNDGNDCTDDACVNELCSYSNNAGSCEDGNPCTGPDSCSGGVCQSGPNPCDDGFACTNDICDGIGGCTYTAVVCNDNNVCTSDACVEPTGCVASPVAGPCDDGNACTVNDSCSGGVCQPGPLPAPQQFCSGSAVAVPALGTVGEANPYPATIVVTGVSTVCKVTVQLNGVSHTWPADMDLLLAGPQGQNAKIMSDVGGGGAAGNLPPPGINLSLDDAAATGMTTIPLVSGTFKPTDLNSTADPAWPAPAPVPVGGSALSIFNGTAGAGAWNLWARDQFNGDEGDLLNGWCITVVGAPCQNDGQCDDQNACTGVEACVNGACTIGTPVVCNDGLFCTLDSCNPADGSCSFVANPCDDLSLCTTDSCDEDGDVCVNSNACVQFCANGSISIPTGGAATPYPSTISVSNLLSPAIIASVELRGFSHLFPDDVDVMVEAPNTQNLILMSDAGGGTPASNLNLIFADSAPPVPDGGPLASTTYSPGNYAGGTDAFPPPAPLASPNTLVSSLNGNPNGTFKLYVIDEFTPDDGSIATWCVNILPVGCQDATECDDGLFCTLDSCSNGTCSNVTSTAVCDDFNVCTTESCTEDNGCGYALVTCDDGLTCTTDSCIDFQGCDNQPTGPADPVGNTVGFSTKDDVSWPSEPAGPYNVYRGTNPATYDQTCFQSGVGPTTVNDPATPAVGTMYYYLVSRDNACGESGLGNGTPGPRPNSAPCP